MDLSPGEVPFRRDGFLMVDVERFQGPLDLLLHLIRQQDIDVFDIPIARITRQFLSAIARIRAEELDSAGEFLEMAATLVRIKAQMLLPRPEDDEGEDPRAELVRRLLEYEQIREISQRLSTAEAERSRQFGKGYLEARPRPDPADAPLKSTWEEVWEAALELQVPDRSDPTHRVTTRTVAMDEKMELILEILRVDSRVRFSHLLEPWKEPVHGVMTFLASLELSRRRRVALRQVRLFSELWLYRRDEESGEVAAEVAEELHGSGAPEDLESARGETT